MEYEVVMGLEVHVELSTESKLFCGCPARFGAGPNENVCPACAGMPGMPAVTNRRAVELGIAAGLLTGSEITRVISFDKKSYFYPDLPCAYQITQYFAPVCTNGRVEIETSRGKRRITLKQIHIEEDAGKLVHDARAGAALIDFNRTSVPLIEIVSNPDFRSAEEVVAYLEKLRSLLSFAGVSDCRMQEGSMRCDVNLSVRPVGSETLGTRTEMKNMNSLKAIAAAIAYESERHIRALQTGSETLVQETRRWDDARGESFSMRGKEDATDYRYFPNPELAPIVIDDEWIARVRETLPETAEAKYTRLTERLGLAEHDAAQITQSRNLSRIFDGTTRIFDKPRDAAGWILVDLLGAVRGDGKTDDDIEIDCEKFAALMRLVDEKIISRAIGKKLLIKVLEEDIDPAAYAEEHGLGLVTDTGAIGDAVREVLAAHEKSVLEYKDGNEKVMGFLMGQIMRRLKGQADPEAVRAALTAALS
ncbi:MAG: Asp-tRNA(Asn)/Glu-tRNA(Gln) amidotransferase subunit GatB [Oscillospiraceae bacterium]|nr:Asp-tRNA(Asn)/Glu-tRNA(Gln) amidotransferase subunit GatB [Oscillospiraceae bacterium]